MAFARRQGVQKSSRTGDPFTQRIAQRHTPVTTRRVDAFSEFIRALAGKFTTSKEEAEAAKQEIFMDILRFAQRSKVVPTHDEHLASLIARRRLAKYLA